MREGEAEKEKENQKGPVVKVGRSQGESDSPT